MHIKDQLMLSDKLSEAGWNAVMDALEKNWLSKISDTRVEYQELRKRMNGKILDPGSEES